MSAFLLHLAFKEQNPGLFFIFIASTACIFHLLLKGQYFLFHFLNSLSTYSSFSPFRWLLLGFDYDWHIKWVSRSNFSFQDYNHVTLHLELYFCLWIYYFDLLKSDSSHRVPWLYILVCQQLSANPIFKLFCLYCLLAILYYQMTFFYSHLVTELFSRLAHLVQHLLFCLLVLISRM